VTGLIVSEVVAFARGIQRASALSRAEMTRLQRIAGLVASGADTKDVQQSVRAELVELLSLRECEFEEAPFTSALPLLGRNGGIDGGRRRWVAGEFTLPAEGVEVPVLGRGRLFGRFVLIPDWDVGVSIEERAVAVVLADQLGAALAARP
jgi:hypothetical protein